jgi:hypothetical protein
VLLKLIAQVDQILSHGLQTLAAQQTRLRWLMARRNEVMRQILLFLAHGQPAQIEVAPELEAVCVEEVIVAEDS